MLTSAAELTSWINRNVNIKLPDFLGFVVDTHNDNTFTIRARVRVTDVNNGEPNCVVSLGCHIPGSIKEEYMPFVIQAALLNTYFHEINEAIHIKNDRVFDPHRLVQKRVLIEKGRVTFEKSSKI